MLLDNTFLLAGTATQVWHSMSNTSASPSTQLDIGGELESFLYTPYGVSTLAGVVALFTSLLWCLGCCLYCFIQRRHSLNQDGVLEASREMAYYGVVRTGLSNRGAEEGEGTMSSGYNTAPIPYSLNSLTGTTNCIATSLDSIIDREA